MIHDILVSCLNLSANRTSVEELLISDAAAEFIHPCEKRILNDIVTLINLQRDAYRFAALITKGSAGTLIKNEMKYGLYLEAFCDGINDVLGKFIEDVGRLEILFIKNSNHSIGHLHHKLQIYFPVAIFLRKLIRGICVQKLHGCLLIQFLHQNQFHGNAYINSASRTISSKLNVIFLKQLSYWIFHAKIIDSCSEFFVRKSVVKGNLKEIEESCSESSLKLKNTESPSSDIWIYEINHKYLPNVFPLSWAEDVLFIGQSVLLFEIYENGDEDQNISLWNNQEYNFMAKIHSLRNSTFNGAQYESVIGDIKNYVTCRLTDVAISKGELEIQLRRIKDFYLLGRGEFYLEFLRETHNINEKNISFEEYARNIVKIFENSAHRIGINEELEQFVLDIPATKNNIADNDFEYIKAMQLKYTINWPLHLLFSPKVMDRYNIIFRFLLLTKNLEYELQMKWRKQREKIKTNYMYSKSMNLLNQLLFFINIFQYYIQVDVLESQFSILLNSVHNRDDFEKLQKTHSVFLANILSLCFLSTEGTDCKDAEMTQSKNIVHDIIYEIFHMCKTFCDMKDEQNIKEVENSFQNSVQQLISILSDLKASTLTTPLTKFLLRLDFNKWFSSKNHRIEKNGQVK